MAGTTIHSKHESEERKLIAAKAKMEARILTAVSIMITSLMAGLYLPLQHVKYLQQTGVIDEELKGLMTSLKPADSPNITSASKLNEFIASKPVPFAFTLVNPPRVCEIHTDYLGKDSRSVVTHKGDQIVVYGVAMMPPYSNRYIAYNNTSNLAGLIDASCGYLQSQYQPHTPTDICVATRDSVATSPRDRPGLITWSTGDYIRICKWNTNGHISGIGFNMVKGEIGPGCEFKVVTST